MKIGYKTALGLNYVISYPENYDVNNKYPGMGFSWR
jgi:hypothetical protein